MVPLWLGKHLLTPNSAVPSAFTDTASLGLHKRMAAPSLLIRKLRFRITYPRARKLVSTGIHTQVCLPPELLLFCLQSFLFYHQVFTRATSFWHHAELLQIKNEEKIDLQSHHFGLKKNVTLALHKFFTCRHGFGEKKNWIKWSRALVQRRGTGGWEVKELRGSREL